MLSFWMRFLKGETETHLQTNPALHTWVFRYTSWSKAGRHVHQSLFHCVAPIKQPSSWRKKVGCCDRFVRQLCWFKGSIEAFEFLSFLRFDNQTLFVHSVAIYISYIQYCLYEDGVGGRGSRLCSWHAATTGSVAVSGVEATLTTWACWRTKFTDRRDKNTWAMAHSHSYWMCPEI